MLWRKRKPSDFRAEIEAHLALETEQMKEQGLSEEEARTAARRAFGNVTRAGSAFTNRAAGFGGTTSCKTCASACGNYVVTPVSLLSPPLPSPSALARTPLFSV